MQRSPDLVRPARTGGPLLVGVVNITEDSYSDGGLYLRPDEALSHARQLAADGADIVELGPAASNPDARPVDGHEQARRLLPVLDRLVGEGVAVSVDTPSPEAQRFAIAHGAAYLNDIRGFPEPDLYPELASAACRLVVMHSVQRAELATRVESAAEAVWASIEQFFDERLAALGRGGVDRGRLILDPGLGYFLGSNPEPSLDVLANLHRLRERFGLPVLVSPSRKSFLRTVTGREVAAVGPASLAAELHAAAAGADYIRTHDVAALHDALVVRERIERERRAGPG
jgi:dihydropteroate synthase type 2